MGRASTTPNPQPPAKTPKAVNEQLRRARLALEALQEQAENTGDWSVEHCSRMAKYWLAMFLQGDRDYRAATEQADKAIAWSVITKASTEAGEWEKRKAGAMASTKVDLLAKVLAKLEEQDAIASELMEIEE